MNKLDKLRARLGEVRDELRALAEIDADELTREQDDRFSELETILNDSHEDGAERGLLAEIEREEKRASLLARANDMASRGSGALEPGDDRGVPSVNVRTGDPYDLTEMRASVLDGADKVTDELRGRAVQAIERSAVDDAGKQAATNLIERHDDKAGTISKLILATGTKEYRSAFAKALSSPNPQYTPDEQNALARAASLTNASGGFAVPFTLDPTVILTNDGSTNPFRDIARVETITTDSWNGVSSAGVTASYKAEATEATDDAATLAQPSIPVHRGDAFYPYSIEIGQDWANFNPEVVRMLNDAKDRLDAEKFAIGDGSDEPTGIVVALTGVAGSTVDTAANNTFAVGDLYALDDDLGDRYRDNATFVANKSTYNVVRQFDTTGGADLWTRLGPGVPGELIGYPARQASAMATGTATDAKIAVLGDFRDFVIVDRVGMTVELVPHLFGANRRPTGQRGWFLVWRSGSDSVNDNAFRLLNVAGT